MILETEPSTTAKRIGVFLIDDYDVVREGLCSLLAREPDMEVVGQAGSAEEALPRLLVEDPDVVVLDNRLPGMTGIELCREIAEHRLRTQVVMLTAFMEEGTVEAAIGAGVRAYVVKDVEAGELKNAIRAASRGETTIDPKVAGRSPSWATRLERRNATPVSPAQVNVLRLLADGHSAAEIATETGLTRNTVKSYLREIYQRLGVNSRAEATAVALRRGLI